MLKEKGFDEDCDSAYYKDGTIVYGYDPCYSYNYFDRPTLQRARKWIRLTHNIHIRIIEDISGTVYEWQIYKDGVCQKHSFVEDTYEESLEEAIKYCLKNLI